MATAVVHECSDESFPIAPPTLQCATKDQHPQTYDANIARGYYFTQRYGDLHGIYIFSGDSKPARDGAFATLGRLRDLGGDGKGVRSDADVDLNAGAPESEYTSVVQSMKDKHSNYAQCTTESSLHGGPAQGGGAAGRRRPGQGLGLQRLMLRRAVPRKRARLRRGEYVDTLYLPFYDPREQQADPMLANFVKYTGRGKADGLGIYAWSAAVAFRDAVNSVVKAHGDNGLTRANLFAALNQIHTFDADGMLAPIDLAGRRISDCHVLMQVRHGAFVRVQPTKPGTFDCNPKYVITRKLDLLAGS